MKKNPPVCPSCGTVFDPESVVKVRRRSTAEEKRKAPAETTPEDIEDIEPIETDSEDGVIEDAEELGDEDAELDDVVEMDDDEGAAER